MKTLLLLTITCFLYTNSHSQIKLPPNDSTLKLYSFLKEWWNVPYSWGGTTKKGIDCSAFVRQMYKTLHGENLPRTAREQYAVSNKISRSSLSTGDLLFFKNRRGVWHVGYYLFDSLFAHSSSNEKGVTISNLNTGSYKKTWFSQGRLN